MPVPLARRRRLSRFPITAKPSPAGIVEHFRRLDAATEIPILVWNAPGQTAVDLSIDTLARLAELPSVAGLVDASGQIGKIAAMPADLRSRLHLYSGHDATALPYCLAGGRGALSVAANVVPRDLCALHDALAAKDVACASDIHGRLLPFLICWRPIPFRSGVKHALHIMFDIPPEVRLPLLEAEAGQRVALAAHVSAPRHHWGRPAAAGAGPENLSQTMARAVANTARDLSSSKGVKSMKNPTGYPRQTHPGSRVSPSGAIAMDIGSLRICWIWWAGFSPAGRRRCGLPGRKAAICRGPCDACRTTSS